MSSCCCSLAGTAACQTCPQNPYAVMSNIITPQPTVLRDIMVNPQIKKPQTNYDRLVSKTPEELAKWIVEIVDCHECEEVHGFRMCDVAPGKACEDYWTGWLKSPVEVDNG